MTWVKEQFYTREEAATEAHRNPWTLDGWRRLGKGPPWARLGRQVLYPRAAFKEWLLAGGERPAEEAAPTKPKPGPKPKKKPVGRPPKHYPPAHRRRPPKAWRSPAPLTD